MTDKQIRIDITSRDDASDTLDDVADAAQALEELSPEVEVGADTAAATSDLDTVDELVDALDRRAAEVDVTADTSSAESSLGDVESAADEVGKLTPEVVVDADTSAAVTDLDSLKTDADALTDADREIILKAKVKDATEALKSLRGGLDDTSKKADDLKADLDQVGTTGGPRLAGNAVSDLTGPLGDASGAAGDFGGVLDGLSDTAEVLGTKMGLSEQAIGGLTSGLGLAGFAVAGVAAGITYFAGKADAARKKQEELNKAVGEFNETVAEGDWKAAADQLVDMFGDAYDAAEDLGIPVKDLTDYITGATDKIPGLEDKFSKVETAIEDTRAAQNKYYNDTGFLNQRLVKQQSELLSTRTALDKFRGKADDARKSVATSNDILAKQETRQKNVAKALRGTADDTEKFTKKNKQATDSVEDLDKALSKLKDQLSFERTLNTFNQDFAEALKKVREGRKLTSDDILELKDNVLDVADFAKMNPAKVKALLRKIERGDIKGVRDDVQAYMDAHTVNTPAGIKLESDAARDAHDDAQNQLTNQGPVYIPTVYAPPGPGSGDPRTRPQPQSILPGPAPVTNVTMYLPRGYREADVIAAGRRAARRSGGLYRRFHR